MNKALGSLEAGTVRDITPYLLELARKREFEKSVLMWYDGEHHLGSHCVAFAKRLFLLWDQNVGK